MPLNPVDWMAREIKFQASWGSQPADWKRSLELMRTGVVTVEPLLSEASYIPLEGIQEAFSYKAAKKCYVDCMRRRVSHIRYLYLIFIGLDWVKKCRRDYISLNTLF
ncbi:MAG: hypothetical protein IH859_07140 [Chloroflexi bacterium]|nr:hypothetical protein [Chloroflexota bacterium]